MLLFILLTKIKREIPSHLRRNVKLISGIGAADVFDSILELFVRLVLVGNSICAL